MMRVPTVSLCFLLCSNTSLFSQEEKNDEALTKLIDALVAKHEFNSETPGVAIMIHQPNKVVFKKGYGLANLREGAPITPRSMFDLASVSKTFTSTAILILHDRGKLSFEDNIRDYLPEMPVYNYDNPIRIKHLLQHVSGLPNYMELQNVPARNRTYWVDADFVPEFARQRRRFPLRFPTNSRYEYSNTNYLLLAVIISRISRKSYGTFLNDEIFRPAGMMNTFVYENPASIPRRPALGCINAVGYEANGKGAQKHWREGWGTYPYRRETLLTFGDGGIWTNLEDMLQYDRGIRADKFVKPETMKRAFEYSRTTNGKTNYYGFGWQVFYNKKNELIGYGHDGLWGGFRTHYYRYITADRTTVILSNRGNFDPVTFWYDLDSTIEKYLTEKK